ncbi:MAG: peptidoglycan synthetase [Crocinitomicaceae bacterium]|nr:peptidoglycan synthetase [Crocinitomicaceae bacterium]
MNVHFIAIGGAAMHNLALALHHQGHTVTGSDDAIHDPSRSRLEAAGLLPDTLGWNPNRIHTGLDKVILGMHAHPDNPELAQASALDIKVVSYPEYLYQAAIDKQRVVVGGSHGKTSITAMLLHVMHRLGRTPDFMVGAQLTGFDRMVQITDAPDMLLEGDEYLSSPVDRTPKFHWYRPHLTILTGIAWDHINVFPNPDFYREQFCEYLRNVEPNGTVVWCEEDDELARAVTTILPERPDIHWVPYDTPDFSMENGTLQVRIDGVTTPLQLVGTHNALNLAGAMKLAEAWGVSNADFLGAVQDFKGAAGRLERACDMPEKRCTVFRDFAHAPSKVKATTNSVRDQFGDRKLIAILELHTFSSLNPEFLPTYAGALDAADEAWVCYSPSVLEHKRLPPLDVDTVRAAFQRDDLRVLDDHGALLEATKSAAGPDSVFLLMSSGRFGGKNLEEAIDVTVRGL